MPSPDYTVKQVAELLQIRRHGVLALIHSGQLRAFNVGLGARPMWRVSQEELDLFRLRRQHQAATPRRRRRKAETTKQYF